MELLTLWIKFGLNNNQKFDYKSVNSLWRRLVNPSVTVFRPLALASSVFASVSMWSCVVHLCFEVLVTLEGRGSRNRGLQTLSFWVSVRVSKKSWRRTGKRQWRKKEREATNIKGWSSMQSKKRRKYEQK